MHLAGLLVDQVDNLPGLAGAERPAAHGTVGVVLVLRGAVPRCQLENFQQRGVVVHRLPGQRGDLWEGLRVGNDPVPYALARRRRTSSIMSSNEAASGLPPMRVICSALANIR